mgnify:CR=1 FL=1
MIKLIIYLKTILNDGLITNSEKLGKLFHENLRLDKMKTQIELMHLDDFFALSGAAELIDKGWDKEAIPLIKVKKSIISSFFSRFF